MITILFFGWVSLAFSADLPVPWKASQTYGPGDYYLSLSFSGATRSARVHLPPQATGGASLPVVLNLHGGGGDSRGQSSQSAMNASADKHGFIVVYPEGIGSRWKDHYYGTWNAGRCCGAAVKTKSDDVGFVASLIDQWAGPFHWDRRRVYATGLSNGAMMSLRLACELSTKIAAIAPVAGQGVFQQCSPTRSVPTLYIHGTADPCAPFKGGSDGGGCWAKLYAQMVGFAPRLPATQYDPVPVFFKRWRALNHVGGKPVTEKLGAVTCTHYGEKGKDNEMALCVVEGGGHTWPGGTYGPICEPASNPSCHTYQGVVGP